MLPDRRIRPDYYNSSMSLNKKQSKAIPSSVIAAVASVVNATASGIVYDNPPGVETITLDNGLVHAEIVPAWAGRLMFFGRCGEENVLWTQPQAASFGCDPEGRPLWKNVGGDKTWVGSQGPEWRKFAGVESGPVWPPPAWFDSSPMETVVSDGTNVVLKTGTHCGGDWEVSLERSFRLDGDTLLIHSRLHSTCTGTRGGQTLPDDDRRLWNVAQIPRPQFALARLWKEGRNISTKNIAKPVASEFPGWLRIDIAASDKNGKVCLDGDALAVPLRNGKWFCMEQTAPEDGLGAFATPGRAMVYASDINFTPSSYAELEFASYGPNAEQTVRFSIRNELPRRGM